MLNKFVIKGTLRVVTGMHIGSGGTFAVIGAVDDQVVKDVMTNRPMLPGSSLKGKLRTLIAMDCNKAIKSSSEDCAEVVKLFGGKIKNSEKMYASKLIFSDMFMTNIKQLEEKEISPTEVKFENTIDRITGVANPRQIERVIRGAEFGFEVIYNCTDNTIMYSDMEMLKRGMELLEHDYLGGSGSRGYGRVKFKGIHIEQITGDDIDDDKMAEYQSLFEEF